MRVMVFVKATENSEKGDMPEQWTREMMEAMGKFNKDLVDAGVMCFIDGHQIAYGLKPTAEAARVAFEGPKRTVIDGPFAETRELVAGFWIWDVKDMDEAIAWVKRCPNPMPVASEIEIRPFY